MDCNRPKCGMCNRKSNHLDIVCKCGGKFCMKHYLPEDHECKFDHKAFDRNRLMKSVGITPNK